MKPDTEVVVIIAGAPWEGVPGTDRRLSEALSRRVAVLWVEPPKSMLHAGSPYLGRVCPPWRIENLTSRITRLEIVAPPGHTRPIIRGATRLLTNRAVRAALATLKVVPMATVLLSALGSFPPLEGRRVLHLTDDWNAGAHLMGLSAAFVRRNLQANVRSAHGISAISPSLANAVACAFGVPVEVLPNGCAGRTSEALNARGVSGVAGLVGNLNERLDLNLLEALVQSGVPLEIVGPITARRPEVVSRLEEIVEGESVTWTGPLAENEMSARMQKWSVGLTPYRLTDFNASSFPLKTLDYLAAGLPVVSTDLPASRWLRCPEVRIAQSTSDYVSEVVAALAREWTAEAAQQRQTFASGHSWESRADQLLALCQGGES